MTNVNQARIGCVVAVLMAVWLPLSPARTSTAAAVQFDGSTGRVAEHAAGSLGGQWFGGQRSQPDSALPAPLPSPETSHRRSYDPAIREVPTLGVADVRALPSGSVPTVKGPRLGQEDGERDGIPVFPFALLCPAVLLFLYAFVRSIRRRAAHVTQQEARDEPGAHPFTFPPEMDAQARKALVDTDDAVRTSQEELGFAAAQFGEEATRPFVDTLERAKRELTAAFRLRQQLDDAYPEDDETRLRMLEEILERCTRANRLLDAESDDFDRLRAFERNAPQALAAAEAAVGEMSGRMTGAEGALQVMRNRYASPVAASAERDLGEATSRLEFARQNLRDGRRASERHDDGAVAVRVRAAEAAVAQASRLIDAVERRARELAEAADALPGALTETDTDLAEARGLLEGAQEVPTAALQGRIARAETVVARVRDLVEAGRYDPIDALRRVEEADAALDEALAGVQESEHGTHRMRALLERALMGARSSNGAAADFITTHRGGVGSEARTRLAEAQRRLTLAEVLSARGDFQRALTEAQWADELAREAQVLAQEDVEGYVIEPSVYGVAGPGLGLAGAMLGGIVLGGGFGGGPVSFGGGATRRRLGGGLF